MMGMGLEGFEKICVKRTGGISSLWLVAADDVLAVAFNSSTREATSITLAPGAAAASYDFREDSARFRETVSYSGCGPIVDHEVSFAFSGFDNVAIRSAAVLADISAGPGVVALVKTNCGDTFLVGYSVDFGSRRPLRLGSGGPDTGAKIEDNPQCLLVLNSKDTTFSRLYTGTVPV